MDGPILGLVAWGALAIGSASAHDLPTIGRSLSVDVVGHIPARCQLTPAAREADFGDILERGTGASAGGSASLSFELDCNSPARLTLLSRNGGLKFEGRDASSDPDFAQLLSYQARTRLGPLGGSGALACDSAEMRRQDEGAGCRARLAEGARGEGEIELTLERGGRPLLSGRYTDTLVMRVTPLLGGDGEVGGKE